jgi:hypothetical protein
MSIFKRLFAYLIKDEGKKLSPLQITKNAKTSR